MRILITGVGGFVGGHLVRQMRAENPQAEIYGIELVAREMPHVTLHPANLLDAAAVQEVINAVQPQQVYHLAAQSSPRLSFTRPWETFETNIRAQLNVLLACLNLNPLPRFLLTSSAEVYGLLRPEAMPISEAAPLQPANPYGVSKVAQDLLGLQYYLSHKLPTLRVRPFNHLGPGQREGFVATDFAMQIARIEAGKQPPVLRVGNLSAQRDFTDVRDVVRAYTLLMAHGTAGEVYNLATGECHTIQELLDVLLRYSRVPIQVETDPARMLPIDIPIIRGDASKLRAVTGWQPRISFEQTVQAVLEDCRTRV